MQHMINFSNENRVKFILLSVSDHVLRYSSIDTCIHTYIYICMYVYIYTYTCSGSNANTITDVNWNIFISLCTFITSA